METNISAKDAKIDLGLPTPKPVNRPPAGSSQAQPRSPRELPRDIRQAVAAEEKRHGGKLPMDPFTVRGSHGDRYLILPNPDTNDWQGIKTSNIPEGLSKMHGCFIKASGASVTAARKYPETPKGVHRVAQGKTDEKTRRRQAAANKLLNARMWSTLKRGASMREAKFQRAHDTEPLRQVVSPIIGLSV